MRKRSSGFALLESLLTSVILVIGILGATALQGYLTTESGVSKARTEALGLAEDKLEEIRNFALEDEGTYLPADGTDSDVVSGINADFTRSWTIGTTGDIKAVSVDVDWTDQRGEAQTASLQAEFTWNPPGGSGYLVSPPPDSFVPSPSGRASLGEGDLIDFPDALLQSTNTDGTELYQSGSDLLLVDTDEDDESYRRVVLTLKEACETEVCTDFVRIEGEVYIDHSETTRDAEDVFVRASDASFCKRWYIVVPDDPDTLLEDETVISTDMSSAPYTAEAARDADYQYFRYTCYLGGGWHGNIGLLFSGGLAQNDKVCQGDPTSNNSWEDEVLGIRRVYRGFLYERDSSTDSGR